MKLWAPGLASRIAAREAHTTAGGQRPGGDSPWGMPRGISPEGGLGECCLPLGRESQHCPTQAPAGQPHLGHCGCSVGRKLSPLHWGCHCSSPGISGSFTPLTLPTLCFPPERESPRDFSQVSAHSRRGFLHCLDPLMLSSQDGVGHGLDLFPATLEPLKQPMGLTQLAEQLFWLTLLMLLLLALS